jgi:hypothetical protein
MIRTVSFGWRWYLLMAMNQSCLTEAVIGSVALVIHTGCVLRREEDEEEPVYNSADRGNPVPMPTRPIRRPMPWTVALCGIEVT